MRVIERAATVLAGMFFLVIGFGFLIGIISGVWLLVDQIVTFFGVSPNTSSERWTAFYSMVSSFSVSGGLILSFHWGEYKERRQAARRKYGG